MTFLHDEKHLVANVTDPDSVQMVKFEDSPGTNEAKDYLTYEDFVKLFARRMKYDPYFLTLVSLTGFAADGESAWESIGGEIESQHSWLIDEFHDLTRPFSDKHQFVLPPSFYMLDILDVDGNEDTVLVDLNDEEDGVLDFDNFGGESDDVDAVKWFINEAGDGYHNVFALWQEPDGEFVGDNAVIRADGDSYSVQVDSQITRNHSYTLFSDNVNERIDEEMGLFIIVQTFSLDTEYEADFGSTPYEIRGWSVEGDSIRGLEEAKIRELIEHADEGDLLLEHATFKEAHGLNLNVEV
jgi:hypothetical protein